MVFLIFFAPETSRSEIRQIECDVLEEKSKENKVLHGVNSSKCRFVIAAQVFAESVTQKGLDYFVMTLRIDQLQAYKNS